MASSRLERLKMLLQADLAALPEVPLDLEDSDSEQQPEIEPKVTETKHLPATEETNTGRLPADDNPEPVNLTSWVDPVTQRNYVHVPSDEEDSDAGCVLELVPLTAEEETPALTPDCTAVSTPPEIEDAFVPSLGLRQGELAPPGLNFCSILALAKFPYKHIERANSERVADLFFNAGKFWTRTWDLFYLWPLDESKPLILISDTQFFQLLKEIESACPDLKLSGQKDNYWDIGLLAHFDTHPRTRPRYLGRCRNRNAYDDMAANAPSVNFTPHGEAKAPVPDDRTLEAFRRAFEECQEQHKQKSKRIKASKRADRIAQQQFIGKQLKRAQRYLGLRPKYIQAHSETVGSGTLAMTATNDKELPAIDPEKPAPYPFEQQTVLIAIDLEAYERDHNMVTEVGVTTLDTKDLAGLAPGRDGTNWFAKARHRHFRIEEFKHIVNSENVQGCPDRFEFGQSEFVRAMDAAPLVAMCFREPFSRPQTREELDAAIDDVNGTAEISDEPAAKRPIVLIGHAPEGDIRYLEKLGYNPLKEPNLVELLDTATLYRVFRREQSPTSLGTMLYSFDKVGWSLHNAGNDAAYTMQVFLAIAVRDATRRGDPTLEEEFKERSQQALKERLSDAVDLHEADQQGFEADVDDDGGEPFQVKSIRYPNRYPRRYPTGGPMPMPRMPVAQNAPIMSEPEKSRVAPFEMSSANPPANASGLQNTPREPAIPVSEPGDLASQNGAPEELPPAAIASKEDGVLSKPKFPPPNVAAPLVMPEASAAAPGTRGTGLESSRDATAGGEPLRAGLPFRSNRGRGNGRTFTDRLNRASFRPPPPEAKKEPTWIVDEDGMISPNPAIYYEVMAEHAERERLQAAALGIPYTPGPIRPVEEALGYLMKKPENVNPTLLDTGRTPFPSAEGINGVNATTSTSVETIVDVPSPTKESNPETTAAVNAFGADKKSEDAELGEEISRVADSVTGGAVHPAAEEAQKSEEIAV